MNTSHIRSTITYHQRCLFVTETRKNTLHCLLFRYVTY
jgi:hypothetical protein